SSRTHTQGESEDHFEASSREFTNHNQCHAVTFLFYRINKTETIKFELVSIERRVLDPVTPMPIPANPFRPLGQVATIPQEVPAPNTQRVETLDRSITSDQKIQAQALAPLPGTNLRVAFPALALAGAVAAGLGDQTPLDDAVRAKALTFVDDQLVKQGL